jgi:antitoxin component of RelBE/YafQ-DinJ toxin-antitoxin module
MDDLFYQISARVSEDFRKQLSKYCDQNNIAISELIRIALAREIGYSQSFHQSEDHEKILKLLVKNEVAKAMEKYKSVEISARKIN